MGTKGWNYHKSYFDKVTKIPRPTYTFELAAVTHLCSWVSPGVYQFAELRDVFTSEVPGTSRTKASPQKETRAHSVG